MAVQLGKLKQTQKMKKLLRNLALVAVAVASAVSCSESGVNDEIKHSFGGVTLYATAPSGDVATKVSFTDEGEQGIALEWEAGDEFKLYQGETLIDTFVTTNGDGKFTSVDPDLTLTEGETYTAKYNETVDLAEQNGEDINNLNSACQMEAEFTYGDDFKIAFAHTKAIITFTFKSMNPPTSLIFKNGEQEYKVIYSDYFPDDFIYTSHIMIEPCDGTTRELKFTLYDLHNPYLPCDIRTVESSIAYKKGYRYTAPISDIVKFSGGSGTEIDPYKISSRADFDELSTDVSGGFNYDDKFFVMTNDVDLGGESNPFTAIGGYDDFQGTFDGAGYAVTGFYINQPESNYQALFGLTVDATIKNLSVSGSVTGNDKVGGVVGSNLGTVTNCYSSVEVNGTGDVGGVVGSNGDTIANCYSSGKVSGDHSVGGVTGYNSGTVANCYSSGKVSGTDYVGGVVGDNGGTATNCYWNSTVNSADGFVGIGEGTGTTTSMTTAEMQTKTFATTLNNNAKAIEGACAWRERYSDFPILLFGSDPNDQLEGIGNGNHVLK